MCWIQTWLDDGHESNERLLIGGLCFRNVWGNVLSTTKKRSVLAPVQFCTSVFVMTWMMQEGVSLLSLWMM